MPETIAFHRPAIGSPNDADYIRGTLPAVIRPKSKTTFEVSLCRSEKSATVRLLRDNETYRGSCDCLHHTANGGTCPHLWAVYAGEQRNAVEIPSTAEILDEPGICPRCGECHNREAE